MFFLLGTLRTCFESKNFSCPDMNNRVDITCHSLKLLTGQNASLCREAHDDLTFQKNRAIRQEVQTNKQTKNYDLWSFKMFWAYL